jgi:glycosyltransferase involved in cell wall biosynthesis
MEEYDRKLLNEIDDSLTVYFFCSNLLKNKVFNKNIILKSIFKYNKISNPIVKFLSYVFSWLKIIFSALKLKPCAIHVQWLRLPLIDYYILCFLKNVLGIKIIYTAHNLLPHNSGLKYKNIFVNIYNLVSTIIVHADRTRTEIMELTNPVTNNCCVIPHGILDSDDGYNFIKSECKRDKFEYLIIGGISKYKGVLEFINLWESLCLENEHFKNVAKLNIIGKSDGVYKCKILNLLEKCTGDVIFTEGELTDYEFEEKLFYCDLIVLPYLKGSQSGVLLKGLSFEKPIFVTSIGGLDQPLSIACIGEVFDFIDITAAKDSLLRSLSNLENKFYSDEGKWTAVREFYNWKRIGALTKKQYVQKY